MKCFLALASILVCTAVLPSPEEPENNIESVNMPEFDDRQPHDVEKRAVSTGELYTTARGMRLHICRVSFDSDQSLVLYYRCLSRDIVHYGFHIWCSQCWQ